MVVEDRETRDVNENNTKMYKRERERKKDEIGEKWFGYLV